jgi:hypothetical protein
MVNHVVEELPIDEGGYFKQHPVFSYGAWQEWDNGVHIFYTRTSAVS